MSNTLQFEFTVDKENKRVSVKKEFAAPLKKVWAAWTTSDLLDKWWAPKPWRAETKTMDFSEGGSWFYAMVGPDGTRHYSAASFRSIDPEKSFSAKTNFSDENGKPNTDFSDSLWTNSFVDKGESTLVDVLIKYDRVEDMEKMMAMGFQGGFTMGLKNLDDLLAE